MPVRDLLTVGLCGLTSHLKGEANLTSSRVQNMLPHNDL
jgi:hypothetical protein